MATTLNTLPPLSSNPAPLSFLQIYQLDFKEIYAEGLTSREHHAIKFSHYYNASTDKVLVLANAAGGVIWVSDPYSGHAADDEVIVHHYPILVKYVPAGSIIFCDKGASHAAVVSLAKAANHDWRIPPRKTTGERFSRAEVMGQATGGSARVVIENVIGGAHNQLVGKE